MEILRSICPIEEKEIAKMRERQKALHLVPQPVTYLDLEVSRKGEVIKKYSDRSKSWVRNFYVWQASQQGTISGSIATNMDKTYGPGGFALKRVSGSTATIDETQLLRVENRNQSYLNRTEGQNWGIVIGTGNSAESVEDYKLSNMIDPSATFIYSAQDVSLSFSPNNNILSLAIVRNLINLDEQKIITEVGIIGKIYYYSSSTLADYLLCRDLINPSILLDVNESLKITYTINLYMP